MRDSVSPCACSQGARVAIWLVLCVCILWCVLISFRFFMFVFSCCFGTFSDGRGMRHCFQEPRCGSRTLICLLSWQCAFVSQRCSVRYFFRPLFRGRGAPPNPLSVLCVCGGACLHYVSWQVCQGWCLFRFASVDMLCVCLSLPQGWLRVCLELFCGPFSFVRVAPRFCSCLFLRPLLLCAHPYQKARGAPRTRIGPFSAVGGPRSLPGPFLPIPD
jgi:hypothetical protein